MPGDPRVPRPPSSGGLAHDHVELAARFALTSLAAWRLTHLLAEEDGPGDAVLRVRAALGDGFFGKLMDCFYCLSMWVAAPLSLLAVRRRRDLPLAWLALSGAACLLEQATSDRSGPPTHG